MKFTLIFSKKVAIVFLLISLTCVQAEEANYLNYFRINSNCNNFFKNDLPSVLDETIAKLENHFTELTSEFPMINGVVNSIHAHQEIFKGLKTRSPKVEIFCARDSKTQPNDEGCGGKAVIASAIYKHNKICLTKNAEKYFNDISRKGLSGTLFHEIYHYISGPHVVPHVDYTVLCTLTALHQENYMRFTNDDPSNFSRNTLSNARKLCATGGIEDLLSESYMDIIFIDGGEKLQKFWIASLCSARESKVANTHSEILESLFGSNNRGENFCNFFIDDDGSEENKDNQIMVAGMLIKTIQDVMINSIFSSDYERIRNNPSLKLYFKILELVLINYYSIDEQIGAFKYFHRNLSGNEDIKIQALIENLLDFKMVNGKFFGLYKMYLPVSVYRQNNGMISSYEQKIGDLNYSEGIPYVVGEKYRFALDSPLFNGPKAVDYYFIPRN